MNPGQQNKLFALALGAVGAGYLAYKQPWKKPAKDGQEDAPVSKMPNLEDNEPKSIEPKKAESRGTTKGK